MEIVNIYYIANCFNKYDFGCVGDVFGRINGNLL